MTSNLIKSTVRAIGKPLNLVFCGLDYAGKTAMFIRLKTGRFQPDISPTLSSTVDTISLKDDDGLFEVNIFDLGGQKFLRNQWSDFIQKGDALLYIIDASDSSRFNEAKEEFIKRILPLINHQPCIIICNKVDLLSKEKIKSIHLNIKEFFGLETGKNFDFISVSQKTGYGLSNVTKFLRNTLG